MTPLFAIVATALFQLLVCLFCFVQKTRMHA